MKRIAHKTVLHVLGWMFIILGVIGIIVPFMPSIPFFFVGIYIISLASLWLWLKLEVIKARFPRLTPYFQSIDRRINKYIKKAH